MSEVTFTAYSANNSTVIYTLEKFYKAREVDPVVSKMQDRITALEAENAELRGRARPCESCVNCECVACVPCHKENKYSGYIPKQEATDAE